MLAKAIESAALLMYLSDKVVVADDDTGNGWEEDRVRRQVGSEIIGAREKIPRAHSETNNGANVAAASDIDVSGQKCGHIRTLIQLSVLFYHIRRAIRTADTELAAIFVPSWARAKAVAIKNTPARLLDVPSSRKDCKRSRGFQIGSPPKMTTEEEETIMPTNDVKANPPGIVKSWDQRASLGFWAKRAKSGSLTIRQLVAYFPDTGNYQPIRVAKLAIALMIPLIILQARTLPVAVPGWWTIGPIPCARTILHIKKQMPAVGTTYAFTVNKCLIVWTWG
jgi:hypothetical protein